MSGTALTAVGKRRGASGGFLRGVVSPGQRPCGGRMFSTRAPT
jgi:hypothetical protein